MKNYLLWNIYFHLKELSADGIICEDLSADGLFVYRRVVCR